VDTQQQGTLVKTSLQNLVMARAEKGPMSSKNLYYTLEGNVNDYKAAILPAIKRNAASFLNPPISNMGYKGIAKTSTEILKWYATSSEPRKEFSECAHLMERGGTGGALFRNLYRDFLREAYEMLQLYPLKVVSEEYGEVAKLWNEVAQRFEEVNDLSSVKAIARILKEISLREKGAMEGLVKSVLK
jgi:hypothetical protein